MPLAILLTGYTQEVLKSQYPDHEITNYMEKPIVPSVLLSAIMGAVTAPDTLN